MTLHTLARLQTVQLNMGVLLVMVGVIGIKLIAKIHFFIESIAGKDNVYSRDCALEGEHNCEKIDSGKSVGKPYLLF